jgi:cytoskeletal protein CcmA (bactofilin family)
MFKRSKVHSLTYLSATSEFRGDLNVEGNLRVDGIVHGNVHVRGDVEISQSGLVEGAELRANNIVVHGVIKARVIAEGRLTLSRTARLEGDVTAKSLDVEAGAFYVGNMATTDVKALPIAHTSKYPELIGREEELIGREEGLMGREETALSSEL